MIRVAMISPLPPQKVGESTYSYNLISELAATGKVKIIAIAPYNAKLLESEIPNVETCAVWNNTSLLYPFTLFRLIRKLRVHLVHVQFGPYGKVYGGKFGENMLLLLILLKLSGIPTTTTLHSTWMPQQVIRRIRNYHGMGGLAIFAPSIFHLFTRLLSLGSTTIQLSTSKIDSLLRKRFLDEYGVSQKKVLEIPHPCNYADIIAPKQESLKELKLEQREIILVFGFIRREKGIECAIEAMKHVREKVPEAILLVAGKAKDEDGRRYLKELKDLCRKEQLGENVKFESQFISVERVPYYFCASSIILAPYTESVGASGPIHNSAGYGVPIVASDVGLHMRESIGGNLVLFKSEDSQDLAAKIIEVLTAREKARKIGERQARYAEKESWNLAANRTLEYYRTTLDLAKHSANQ